MPSAQLTYLLRVSSPGGMLVKGPVRDMELNDEYECRTRLASFEYCHTQSSQATQFAMQNNVSVSGIVKAFNISASHASQYATASEKACQQGVQISRFQEEFVKHGMKQKIQLKEGEVLVHYMQIQLLCFTIDNGQQRYLHVPSSEVVHEVMSEAGLRKLAGSWNLDRDSWEIVMRAHNIPTTPMNTLQAGLGVMSLPSGVRRIPYGALVGIFSESNGKRLDIGGASVNKECPASHESWATRFYIRRVDGGPNKGPVSPDHLVGIFSETNGKRLDIGIASMKAECAASHESWATRFRIKPLKPGAGQYLDYSDLVGIFSESNDKRLDVGSGSVKKECPDSHESWATRFRIKLL